jgi:hypothetical protein
LTGVFSHLDITKGALVLKNIMQKIDGISPWHFLWIGILFSEFFTLIMNTILSLIWWDYISIDLILIGTIDAFIVALLVSLIIIYFLNRIKEADITNRQLNQEIKILRDMLPICCNCKKIRTEEGLWKMVEDYISQHSDVKFTHSYCPECIRELYPDLADGILADANHDN